MTSFGVEISISGTSIMLIAKYHDFIHVTHKHHNFIHMLQFHPSKNYSSSLLVTLIFVTSVATGCASGDRIKKSGKFWVVLFY